MTIEIQPAAASEKSVLRHLLELYLHDLGEYDQADVDEHGLYGYPYLDHNWAEPG